MSWTRTLSISSHQHPPFINLRLPACYLHTQPAPLADENFARHQHKVNFTVCYRCLPLSTCPVVEHDGEGKDVHV